LSFHAESRSSRNVSSPRLSTSEEDNRTDLLFFWAIFERSRIPMSLIDAERRYVAVNDATVDFVGCPREELVGREAGRAFARGRALAPGERAKVDAAWEELRRTGEYCGDRVVKRADGSRIRVEFGVHASTASGRWLAMVVVLSARVEPDGPELIAADAAIDTRPPAPSGPRLTRRERDVVRLVALGAGTRQVAADLFVSPDTVRSHVRNAMSKTGARTRAQLVAIALAEGLIGD
jgi:PAS domain S-box-containing protein